MAKTYQAWGSSQADALERSMFSQCPESLVMNFKEFSVEFGPIEIYQHQTPYGHGVYGYPATVVCGQARVFSRRTGACLDTFKMSSVIRPDRLMESVGSIDYIRREIQDALFKSMDTHIPAIEAKLQAERLEFSLPQPTPEPMPARSRL